MMKRILVPCLVSFFLLGLSSLAWAQVQKNTKSQTTTQVIQGKDKIQIKKLTVIRFTGGEVNAKLAGPQGQIFTTTKKPIFKSLIDIRKNFLPELNRRARSL